MVSTVLVENQGIIFTLENFSVGCINIRRNILKSSFVNVCYRAAIMSAFLRAIDVFEMLPEERLQAH